MKKLFDFEGRIGRKRFTFLFLVTSIVYAILALAFIHLRGTYFASLAGEPLMVFKLICGLVLLPPALIQLSAMAKRLHDLNRSGWYILTGFIPVVQFITIPALVLILIFKKGNIIENKYGQIGSGL